MYCIFADCTITIIEINFIQSLTIAVSRNCLKNVGKVLGFVSLGYAAILYTEFVHSFLKSGILSLSLHSHFWMTVAQSKLICSTKNVTEVHSTESIVFSSIAMFTNAFHKTRAKFIPQKRQAFNIHTNHWHILQSKLFKRANVKNTMSSHWKSILAYVYSASGTFRYCTLYSSTACEI